MDNGQPTVSPDASSGAAAAAGTTVPDVHSDLEHSIRKLFFRFALALVLLVVVTALGTVTVDLHMQAQRNYAADINLAGRQRMLTMRAAGLAGELVRASDAQDRATLRRWVSAAADELWAAHQTLHRDRRGWWRFKQPAELTAILNRPPYDLVRRIQGFQDALYGLADSPDAVLNEANPDFVHVTAAALVLVAAFEAETATWQRYAERQHQELQVLQVAGLGVFIALLLGLAGFVFRPMLYRLRAQASELEQLNRTLEDKVVERTREAESRAAALREQEARVRGILQSVADMVITTDEEGRVESFNPAAERAFGYSAAEIVGQSVHRLLRPQDRQWHQEEIERYRRTGQSRVVGVGLREGMAARKSGAVFPVEIALGEMQIGGRRLFIAALRDISERKRAEAELRIRDTAIASSLNPIVMADMSGRLTYVNAAFLRLWGYGSPAEVLGRPSAELWNDANESRAASEALTTQGTWMGELEARHRDGSRFVVAMAANVVNGEGGWPVCVMGSFIDITQRKRAEQALRAAKEEAELANRAKSEFLANMSHELRTPLNAIIGFSEIMERELMGPLGTATYRDYSRDIHESGRHLLDIINDILDLSRIEAGRMELREEECDPARLVAACLRMIRERAEAARIQVGSDVAADMAHVWVDERLIKQVLLNLLSNAVKFTPAGGQVTVRAWIEDGRAMLAIADSGIGMSPDQIPLVLKPFVQVDSSLARRYQGTGLGLPLAKSLAELHGGELTIESAPGKGTVATVRLPAHRLLPVTAGVALRA